MRILHASTLGMCFGVKQALQTARQITFPQEVTILGELAHNPQIQQDLFRRGFKVQREIQREHIPDTRKVLITAHGISDNLSTKLIHAGKDLINATCPFVQRIHLLAKTLQNRGYFILLIGKPDHVEVKGIIEDLPGSCDVLERIEDVERYANRLLGVLCQSTTSHSLSETIVREIYRKNPGKKIKFINTICQFAQKHQAAVRQLLPQVDAVIVIGGKNSNNTKALVSLAKQNGVPALHIENASELSPEWLEPYSTVGLTAGTSTPNEVIEEVYEQLLLMTNNKHCFNQIIHANRYPNSWDYSKKEEDSL